MHVKKESRFHVVQRSKEAEPTTHTQGRPQSNGRKRTCRRHWGSRKCSFRSERGLAWIPPRPSSRGVSRHSFTALSCCFFICRWSSSTYPTGWHRKSKNRSAWNTAQFWLLSVPLPSGSRGKSRARQKNERLCGAPFKRLTFQASPRLSPAT